VVAPGNSSPSIVDQDADASHTKRVLSVAAAESAAGARASTLAPSS
jgi:hypothetical protein